MSVSEDGIGPRTAIEMRRSIAGCGASHVSSIGGSPSPDSVDARTDTGVITMALIIS